jgi:hypothetical protein
VTEYLLSQRTAPDLERFRLQLLQEFHDPLSVRQSGHLSSCGPGGTLVLRLLSLTIERLRERMVVLGARADEIDEARRMLEDPANMISSQTTYVAHGRKP